MGASIITSMMRDDREVGALVGEENCDNVEYWWPRP